MAVVKIKNGKVVQTWRDVPDVAAAVAKYGLDPADLVEGDHPSGTLYNGSVFIAPLPTMLPPKSESPAIRAIRVLAAAAGQPTEGRVVAIIGPEPIANPGVNP